MNLKEHPRSAGNLREESGNCGDEEVGGVETTIPWWDLGWVGAVEDDLWLEV